MPGLMSKLLSSRSVAPASRSGRPLRTRLSGALLLLGHAAALGLVAGGELAVGLAALLATHGFFLLGTLWPNSPLFGPVVRRFETPRNEVWLTIDDGVDPATTPQLIDCLERNGVAATHFVIGRRAARYPELIERLRESGQQLGDHSQTHPKASFWAIMPWQLRQQIAPRDGLFRSPVGMSNWFVHEHLHRRGLRPIGWTVRGLDGVASPREQVLGRLIAGIRPGAILLLHDGYDPRARGYAPADIAAELIEAVRACGYRCVIPDRECWRA